MGTYIKWILPETELAANKSMCHCVTSTVLKFVQIKCPAYMNKVFRPIENIRINTRNSYFKPSFSKNQYRTRRLILEILKETKNLSTFKHKMKHYYLNDLYNPNLWSITGFDYVLAIIEYFSFHFHFFSFFLFFSCFTLTEGPQSTMKTRLFPCFVLSLPYYFSSH